KDYSRKFIRTHLTGMIGEFQKSFLLRLTAQLAAGWQDVEPERTARHREFILTFQQADGGFAGREGGSDLYYTSFAVRGLALLDGLDADRCQVITSYLEGAAARQHYSLIDLVSWFYSAITVQIAGNLAALADEVSSALEAFRRVDGGYAKTHEGGV